MLLRSLSVVLVLFGLVFSGISSERLDVTSLFKQLDDFARQPLDSTINQNSQSTIPFDLPYVETFICAMEPSKVEKCRKEAKTETNFLVEKFKELKEHLSAKISKEKSEGFSSKLEADEQEKPDDYHSIRTIECPESHTITILNAFMTNKNKYMCQVPVEKFDSDSVCNSTTETLKIVQDLCERKEKCTIKIDEQFKDICTCIDQHYLNLTYACLPSSQAKTSGVKETTKTKRNTLRHGGRNFRLNFVDPFYDFFPQFYTGPLGILGFDIAEIGLHTPVNEPFPLNYDFFPGNWHGWGGWGNLLEFPHAHDHDNERRSEFRQHKSNIKSPGRQGRGRNGGGMRNNYQGNGKAQNGPFNRGGAGSFKKHGAPIRTGGKGPRRSNKFNLVSQP